MCVTESGCLWTERERETEREGEMMNVKYRRHLSSLTVESPLAKTSIHEETATNGLSDIALCSSRSRAHRNSGSFGRHSRKNSHDKDVSSPKQRKVGVSGKRDSLTEDGSIVLDPTSLLDEIMAKTFNEKESEEEKTPPPPGMINGTASSSYRAGQGRRGSDRERESESSRQRSAAMDTTSSVDLKSKAKQVSRRSGSVGGEGEGGGEGEREREVESLTVPSSGYTESVEMRSSERKTEIRRSGSVNKEDYRRSGGNWGKLRGTFTAGKALGMFYHNRRSQHFEDSLEERPKLEQGQSLEALPVSPLAETSSSDGFGQTAAVTITTETEPEVRG